MKKRILSLLLALLLTGAWPGGALAYDEDEDDYIDEDSCWQETDLADQDDPEYSWEDEDDDSDGDDREDDEEDPDEEYDGWTDEEEDDYDEYDEYDEYEDDEYDEYEDDEYDEDETYGDQEEPEDNGTDPWQGQGTSGKPYKLNDEQDFLALQERVNVDGADYTGKYFLMTEDITLPDDWTPIGCLKPGASGSGTGANLRPFTGTINGGGHTLTVPAGGLPLLGFARGATVHNMNLYGAWINGDGLVLNYTVDYGPSGVNTGSVPATINIDSVTILSGTQILRSGFIGALVDCDSGSAYSQTSADNIVNITNCTVQRGVVIGCSGGESDIGSFAGQLNGTVSGCVSYAAVQGADNVGGIVGSKSTSMGQLSISNCQFHGSVDASGDNAGGIVGSGYDNPTAPNARGVSIQNCTADGDVSGASRVGGILGNEGGIWQSWENGACYIRNNTFNGTVSGGSYVGGALGYYRSLNRYNIIENNICSTECGVDRGIGSILYVDSAIYANGKKQAVGWKSVTGWPEQVYCFDTAEDDLTMIRDDLGQSGPYTNISRKNHQRYDDPLGADLEKLVSMGTPAAPYTVSITVSGSYKTEYLVGEALDLTGAVFAVQWSNGAVTYPTLEEVTVSPLDSSEPGEQTITISYGTTSTTIQVTVKKEEKQIKVTFSILGDTVHNSDSDGHVHGLRMGGLTTWAAPKTYEVSTNDTVWDLMQRVMKEKGITASVRQSMGSVYVTGLTYRGVYLGEYTNGANSGWQYVINGRHPTLGVAQQYMKNKDVIIFHYTDDYTKEEGSENYDRDQQAAATVVELINAIPDPVTPEARTAVETARAAFDALESYTQRSQVTNYQRLLDAEAALEQAETEQAERLATAQDREAAAAADRLIEEAADEESLIRARAAVDALTDLQRKLLKNRRLLEQKERQLTVDKLMGRWLDIYEQTARYIESLGDMDASSAWSALGFARSGRKVSDSFYPSLVEEVLASANEKEQLHRAKSSENARAILVLTSLGYDVTDVAGHDLLRGLTDLDYVKKQGINGPIWALIAMNSHAYTLPEDPSAADRTTREKIIQFLLERQLPDGGWALTGEVSDSDITGMCLQALAPYYRERADVTAAVDRALLTVSMMQNADGSFSTFGGGEGLTSTSESISQILVGLTALGIDPGTDPRFIRKGNSAVDALCGFYIEGGGFAHLNGFPRDGIATEQGYYALTAYFRLLDGKTALYDMSDVPIASQAPAGENAPVIVPAIPDSQAAGQDAPEEPEDVALAVFAAAEDDDKNISPLLWGVPGVGLLGLATWWLDKLRRSRKKKTGR